MKRILKFRIWDYAAEAFVDDGAGQIIYECIYDGEVEYQQYTGLKDKNGKDIYEGDIVEGECATYGKSIAVVGLDTYLGAYYTDIDYYPCEAFTHCFCMKQEHNKIIGNIFENPELLK